VRDPLDIVKKCIALSASSHDGEATAAALKACALIREHGFQVIGSTVKVGAATRASAPVRPTPSPASPYSWKPPRPPVGFGYSDFFGVDFGFDPFGVPKYKAPATFNCMTCGKVIGTGVAPGRAVCKECEEKAAAERRKREAEAVKTDAQKRKEDLEEQERVERSKKRMAHEEEVRAAAAKAKLDQEFERARQVMETLSLNTGDYNVSADEMAENIRKVADFMRRSYTGRW
jgi:uncharacterized Zn finger protein (UPF0148 family)